MPTIKGAPIYGTYGGYYDDDGEGGSNWVAEGPGYWDQDSAGENYWVGDKYITGYEPDVFVPDTTGTGTTGTGTTGTGTTGTGTTDTGTTDTGTTDTGTTDTGKGDPIYGTEPQPEQTDFGDGDYRYDYGNYTTGYFSDPDEYGDRDWFGNPTDTIIGYNPTASDTTTTDTGTDTTTGTTTTDTDTTTTGTTDTVVYTPPPIDLGLDIPSTTYSAPVGPPGDLGLGIPVAPTYYQEYVPPQQPVVPQLTQAELLQQIVNQGQGAQGFQDGGLATPVQEPMPMVGAGIASLQNRIQKQQVRSPLSSGIGGQGAVLGSFR